MNFAWGFTAFVLFFLLVINAIYINTLKDKSYKTPAKGFAIFTMIIGLFALLFSVYEASQTGASTAAKYVENPYR
jgi:hypothetical protein